MRNEESTGHGTQSGDSEAETLCCTIGGDSSSNPEDKRNSEDAIKENR